MGGVFFFFQAEDGIRDSSVTGVQTCALPISRHPGGGDTARDTNRDLCSQRLLRRVLDGGRERSRGGGESARADECEYRAATLGCVLRLFRNNFLGGRPSGGCPASAGCRPKAELRRCSECLPYFDVD